MDRHRLAACVGLCALVLASGSAQAQGNSQNAHANNGAKNSGRGNSGKGKTPNQSTLPPPTGIAGPAAATPFAWIDDATLMAPGTVWIGTSIVRWTGDGLSEVSVPVLDAAAAVTPRVQVAMSMPRVLGSGDPTGPQGGWGTTFANVKIGLVRADTHGFNIAAAPTIEILSEAAIVSADTGQSRMQWGLPISADIQRGTVRVYGSTGYFSPGVWFAGGGMANQVHQRVGISLSFSRSWSSSVSTDPTIEAPTRNELAGGGSFEVTPNVAVFGSVGQTIATGPENGGGRTFSVGVALTTSVRVIRQ